MAVANSNLSGGPGPIGDWEKLGRGVFSSRQADTAAKTGVPAGVFLEQAGKCEISVDRITRAPEAEAAENAGKVAAKRNPPRNFYGWATVSAEETREAGFEAVDSPLPGNRYHADIILPDVAAENREAQVEYAATLAGMAEWRPYPPEADDRAT